MGAVDHQTNETHTPSNPLLMFSSLRAKLILILTALGVVPLVVVGVLFYTSAASDLLAQTKDQIGNLADKTARQVDDFFAGTERDIRLLSDFPFVQLAFLQVEFGQRLDTVVRLLEEFRHKNDRFQAIHLIDLSGRTLLSVPENPPCEHNDATTTPWFRGALEKGLYLSGADGKAHTGGRSISLAKTVHDFEFRDRTVGLLVFDIRPTAFTEFVSSVRPGSRGYAFMMAETGEMIYHPAADESELSDDLAATETRLGALLDRMRAGKSGFGEYHSGNREKFLVYRPCMDGHWSVGITVFRSDLMAGIDRLRRQMFTLVCAIIVLIAMGSVYFVRLFTRPIRQLIDGAEAFGGGDLDHVIRIPSGSELGEVAGEFNRMAGALKASMQKVIELKTFSEDILRNVSSGIITVDRTGRVTSINQSAAAILGVKDAETLLAGEAPPHASQLAAILDLLTETRETGEDIQNRELILSDNSSAVAVVEVTTSLFTDVSGRRFGAIADIRDITRRKRMEELMVRVDKLASLGELSAGMAHEIRNPLAGIKTSVQVLARRLPSAAETVLTDGILFEINRLDKIVTDLLHFSRPLPPVPSRVDIGSVLEKAVGLVAETMRTQKIVFRREYDGPGPFVTVDREQIQQVFLNLLLNAVKAMPDGGELTVRVQAEPLPADDRWETAALALDGETTAHGLVRIIVADTGMGIDPRNLGRIFNPFFTTDPKGTGLGLPIAHKLLSENRGRIYVDSVMGQGTRVTLLLPADTDVAIDPKKGEGHAR